ncbi:hypothetical protein BV25DRAFT_1826043, partial [Artomyces pyxidatus]
MKTWSIFPTLHSLSSETTSDGYCIPYIQGDSFYAFCAWRSPRSVFVRYCDCTHALVTVTPINAHVYQKFSLASIFPLIDLAIR